jgi:hypothetical protein
MGYNPYRWWTKGKRHQPLKSAAPLLLKIRNGDFEYSEMFQEADEMKNSATEAYNLAYKNYGGTDESNRIQSAIEAGRMKRLKSIKLQLEADIDENRILIALRKALLNEFGKDLWDKAMERQRGKGTTEDLYWWYKKQVKMVTTPSEMDIKFNRPNTIGLEYLYV